MTIAEAIRDAAKRLAGASDTARLDAELLMAHALGMERSQMLLRAMPDPVPVGFAKMVERRARHEPVAYITGKTEFFGLELAVAPGVLIPRGDSETLIEAAREAFAGREPPKEILDLGTGSGALLLAALSLFPGASGVATDASAEILPAFARNVEAHAAGRTAVSFVQADWRERGWSGAITPVDLILCNPPYVEDDAALDRQVRDWEPASALFAGPEGLDDYRILIPQLRALMNAGAVAILEIGASQAQAVGELAEKAGFATRLRHDLANRPRALVLS
ncbi:MAG: peptide chain release factor N(5)-glutamine methyltransferase [Erythrobacter sp.]|jgi:release factor glutamine methyltransferase|nr:peptide chain release factor N(5)-glutamine methyltransferase [Erythrobacter sp.]